MRNPIPVLALLLALLACSLPGVVAETPTLEPTAPEPTADFPTITPTTTPTSTPTAQAAPLPTTAPTATSTEVPFSTPIRFAVGDDRAAVEADLQPGERDLYTVRALDGQSAALVLRSPERGLIMDVRGAVEPATAGYRWQGLTTGGTIVVEVFSPEGFDGPYRLDVIILPVGEAGIPMVAPAERCFMTVALPAEILSMPSAESEVLATGEVVAGEPLEVAAMTPDDAYYALFPLVAQAAGTGVSVLRWVRARDATLDGLCTYVDEVTLAEVEADVAFDQRPSCEVRFTGEQAYSGQPGGEPLGAFGLDTEALAYAATTGHIGVLPPMPRYGRYGLDRLVWVPLEAGTLEQGPACTDLETVDYP